MSKKLQYLQYDFHTGMCNTSSPVNIKVMFDQIKNTGHRFTLGPGYNEQLDPIMHKNVVVVAGCSL